MLIPHSKTTILKVPGVYEETIVGLQARAETVMKEQLEEILQEAEVPMGSAEESLQLSSLQVISIVTALEERFGIVIVSQDVRAENFQSRAALLALVRAKQETIV